MAESNNWNVLRCLRCSQITHNDDKYLLPCCAIRLLCQECYVKQSGKIYCGKCCSITTPTRISREFFANLRENLETEVRQKIFKPNGKNVRGYELNNTIFEEPIGLVNSDTKVLTDSIYAMLKSYEHGDKCYLYQNVGFLCNTTTKLKKSNPGISQISIHDVMAFLCHYCGHGSMNKGVTRGEEVIEISNHGMNECMESCCGLFLDRRNLQYNNGECRCGVEILLRLEIRPATESEHNWRHQLYMQRPTNSKRREIGQLLNPFVVKMGLKKPCMLSWYLMTRGDVVHKITSVNAAEAEVLLWEIIAELNGEFNVNRPIQ